MRRLLLLAATAACFACGGPPPEAKTAPSAEMPGTPSPKLAGNWELTSGGKSTMELHSDGTSRIVSEAHSPGGTMKSDVSGKWSEQEGRLYMRRQGPDGHDFTAEYRYTLEKSGKELKLSTDGRRAVQTYAKK